MKLSEIKLTHQEVQESFVPGNVMLALQMLASGQSENISHKFILAQVAFYLKQHKNISLERFRELNEVRPPLEFVNEIKEMTAKKLQKMAAWVVKFLENEIKDTEEEGYTNPQEELMAFLNTPRADS